MKNQRSAEPPRWAQRFLEWYCKPEIFEDLQGDLLEYFSRNCQRKSLFKAKVIYIIDVFKFLRLYTIKKPDLINYLIHWIMIGSYIRTSGRSILRNKLFSTINIVGLAISMSVGLLTISFLIDLYSYDDFHVKGDRIYRIVTKHVNEQNRTINLASTSVLVGKKVKEEITGVDNSVILRNNFRGDVNVGDEIFSISGLYAGETFFDVFSFQVLHGDRTTALKEANTVVITETTARKLFGKTDVVGESVRFLTAKDTSLLQVTAVIKDVPKFSHLQFEALCSFKTAEENNKDDDYFLKWENVWSNYVYVLIPETGNTAQLQASLDKIAEVENRNLNHINVSVSLQPLKEIALGKDLSNPVGPTMLTIVVYVFAGLSVIVIISACFNYTNLSIARSLRRSKEVGIRKVMGAFRNHVLMQFIIESIIIALIALVLSWGIYVILREQFLMLAPHITKMVDLNMDLKTIIAFILFAILVGVIAGILPAIFFSKVNAVKVLKDATTVRAFRNVNMRKVLIVVQYTFSLMFITATIIGYKQYQHMLAFDLGYNTENIFNIELQGNNAEVVMKELGELKEVEMMSRSSMVTSVGSYWGTDVKYNDPNDSASVGYNTIDHQYLPIHEHKLLAGHNFTAHTGEFTESEVIVNEQLLKRFNIAGGDPQKALGEEISIDNKKLTIIGVMKDFHYGKLDSKIDPVMFRYSNNINEVINAKVVTNDWPSTLKAIESKWKKIDKVHPLEAYLYKDEIAMAYSEYSVMTKVIGFLAFLAITIASMGLFGMVVFTTETRLKEISIRKVLGASEGRLIFLLSRGFLILLFVAGIIALPLTYIFFDKVVLAEIIYHAPLSVSDFLIGLISIVLLALVMIGSQTLKVARANPAEVLKTE